MSTGAAATAITMVRRTLIAVGGAAVMAALIRLRGTGGVPPRSGGWRELTLDELSPETTVSGDPGAEHQAVPPDEPST